MICIFCFAAGACFGGVFGFLWGGWSMLDEVDAPIYKSCPDNKEIRVDDKILDFSKARIKTYHPGAGEYCIGRVWEVR